MTRIARIFLELEKNRVAWGTETAKEEMANVRWQMANVVGEKLCRNCTIADESG
jgi:hypothetical protein